LKKQYLFDLGTIARNGSVPVGSDINTLQNNLGNVYTNYLSANSSVNYALDHQKDMQTIINTENDRLNAKKQQVDNIISSQQRIVELNESYRKRQSQYIYIIIVFVIALILYIFIVKLKIFLPFIPDAVIDLLLILLVGAAVVYIIYIYKNISYRDNLNYDNIIVGPPPSQDASGIILSQQAASASGNLLQSVYNPNNCVGQSCCSANSVWESSIYKCIDKCDSGKYNVVNGNINGSTCVTATDCSNNGYKICGNSCVSQSQSCFTYESFSGNLNVIKPYEPYEFDGYAKI